MYWVYILRNKKGVLYKGFTSNLKKRIIQHAANDGFNSYTQKRGPWNLIYCEEFETEQAARSQERFFKSGQGRQWLKEILGDYPPKADG